MPHLRPRHLDEPFLKLIRLSRIVGIFGHRQAGKTTFLETHAREMVTLDDEDTLAAAQESPKRFIEGLRGDLSAIDECQLVPDLFPALKNAVQGNKKPGQFLLSGSVRFTSRRAIRESLTGRIMPLELLPMVLTELENESNSSFLIRVLESASLERFSERLGISDSVARERTKTIEKYLTHGGLPGLCFIRDERPRMDLMRGILETILDRDVRLVYPTTLAYSQLLEFAHQIAESAGSTLRATSVTHRIGLSAPTQKKLLAAFEAIFLIRRIPIEGDYRGDSFLLEDQLEARVLTRGARDPQLEWEELVFRNLRAQLAYRVGENASYFRYHTRGGVRVPIGIRCRGQHIGVIPVGDRKDVDRSRKSHADSFLKTYAGAKVVFITRQGSTVEPITDRILIVPAQIALF